jgi:hypothetical protein
MHQSWQRVLIRFLWTEDVPGAEIHRRLSAQYGNSALPQQFSVYEWVTILQNGSTSVTVEEWSGCPATHTLQRKTLNESVPWFWITDGWRWMKWHIIYASVMVLLMESSKTDYGFLKTEPDGFQNNLQDSTSAIVLQTVKACWTAITKKVTLFRDAVTVSMTWIHHHAPASKHTSIE